LFGGSTAHDVPDRTTQFDASPLNEMLANGSPAEPPVNGSYANGSYADGSSANGSYVADFPADSHVESRADEAYGNGAYGSYRDEPAEPAWPSLGASGYVPPDDGWLLGYGSGSVAEPDLGVDDMPWAPAPTGFAGSHPSSALAADGSDDWTLPLPVIRAEPPVEPDPVRDPVGPPTRGRRARRAAEEPVPGAHSSDRPRYAGHGAPDPATDHAGRASRRNGSAHARHAEEWDDIVGPVDRGRHRRPDH
jgi:hypothetical protein